MPVLARFLSILNEAQGDRKVPRGRNFLLKRKQDARRTYGRVKRVIHHTKLQRSLKKELIAAGMGAGGKNPISQSQARSEQLAKLVDRVANSKNVRAQYGTRLFKTGLKGAALLAALGVAGKASLMTYDNLKNKPRRPKYDIYSRYGNTVANTEPYSPRYVEPQFNVYESVYQDLMDRNR